MSTVLKQVSRISATRKSRLLWLLSSRMSGRLSIDSPQLPQKWLLPCRRSEIFCGPEGPLRIIVYGHFPGSILELDPMPTSMALRSMIVLLYLGATDAVPRRYFAWLVASMSIGLSDGSRSSSPSRFATAISIRSSRLTLAAGPDSSSQWQGPFHTTVPSRRESSTHDWQRGPQGSKDLISTWLFFCGPFPQS